jgi:serine/threonine protein kinase
MSSAAVSKAVATYLGSYRLLNVVNTGQTSQVWQAYHDGMQQFVAVKTLLEKYRKDREQLTALKREYTVGTAVADTRIIRIYEYAVDRGAPFLAMEWFPAPNLKFRIHQGVEAIAHLVPTIALEVTEALVSFSKAGWIHRDVKPENFLVADDGDIKLIDFSLAQRKPGFLAKFFGGRTKVQGTRSYMSPEQILGKPLDERADLYSLACTLFELIGGKPPFTGTSSNDLLTKHLRASPPPLEAANRNVTPEFAQLIRRAMAKKPAARFKSIEEFYDELRRTRIFRRTPTPPAEAKKTGS